jgi:HAD superfamily hydrolase (TIGR01509 family)/HAD superfamily hydrolase (TIGR01549 family)
VEILVKRASNEVAQVDGHRYGGVIFDVGGTLIGFPNWEPFGDFLAQAGLPSSKEDALAFRQRLIAHTIAERDNVQGMGADEGPLNAWWHGVFRKTWPDRPDLADEMYRWLRQDRFDRLFTDAVPALERLRGLGMPMGVVSNFARRLESQLGTWGVRGYFDFVIVSSVVGIAKPDPRIFELAVAEAGHPPHRLLYVGDHVGDDIEGARGAGLDAVLIDRWDQHSDALCPRVSSLEDLAVYVQSPRSPAPVILLDMDGVVLDSPPLHLLTWQQTLKPLGVELTADLFFPLEGMPTELTAKKLTELLLGRACSDQEARRLATRKRELFGQIFQPTFVPGIVPLLHDLHGRGYRLGLVTGSARSVVDESLAPTGYTDLFEVIVTGDEVMRGKPDPEPYQIAAGRLGVRPSDCLVIENAPSGIQSAQAAGMACVALATTLPTGQLASADRVFGDAADLRIWFLSQWKGRS